MHTLKSWASRQDSNALSTKEVIAFSVSQSTLLLAFPLTSRKLSPNQNRLGTLTEQSIIQCVPKL